MATERRLCAALILWLGAGGAAVAEAPMSAIDWLSSSVALNAAASLRGSAAVLPPLQGEAPISAGVQLGEVSVQSLDAVSADSLGLIPAARIGLPRDLWGRTPEPRLAEALRKERLDTLPSVQGFLLELMLAELDPPQTPGAARGNGLFLARIDRLLDLGALDQAMALLEQADPDDPEIFRRRFDIALLLDQEHRACEIMEKSPAVAPSYPARIFCLARRGKWDAAALNLSAGRVLGQIEADKVALLERFLDPQLAEDSPDLPPPPRVTPLTFRLMEAIGQPLSTTTLPVAFAQADLRSNSGWKAQIEAAERLARMGVIDPNQLLGFYTQERASASGGVWDRVSHISQLDAALSASDAMRVQNLLPQAWALMQAQELETAFAAMFAPRLRGVPLSGAAAEIAFRAGLLTADFETVAAEARQEGAAAAFLAALARGNTAGIRASDQLGLMLKRVFDAPPAALPPAYADLVPDRLGESILVAIDDISEGAKGDHRRLEQGLTLLRMAGLESLARRTALELTILERRG